MKNIILLISLLSVHAMASTACSNAKINQADEIIMEKSCESICIIKALGSDAREYLRVKSVSGMNIVQLTKYLDTPNSLQEAAWEASDIVKIYSSSKEQQNKATIAKYFKVKQVLEIIQKKYGKDEDSVSRVYNCK
ncbi:hypothetical protein [Bacteriovorax sp. Seq25_V]|uniref:hypothetical protein n=1 Tax=Bacteriovorax sp. Seq25_V TaxID=1201288 RepID=UPI000389FD9B|nr:hypothetical protein [Bacteriovorax sp. Seq25_V]EQC46936.1 putative lipoprotein [Bacteriovorax sp. Seq25_V]